MSSIQSKPGMGEVTIENPVPYAAIHNDGDDIPPTVSPKMRRFVWHMAYSLAGTKGRGGHSPRIYPRRHVCGSALL